MIEIKKVTDPAIAKKICDEAQIELDEGLRIIATVERGEVLNSAVFDYQNEEGRILHINGFDGDILLLDGLCRAILNIMDIQGVKVVYLPLKFQKLAQYIGFKQENKQYVLQLEGFFNCGCCHKEGEK